MLVVMLLVVVVDDDPGPALLCFASFCLRVGTLAHSRLLIKIGRSELCKGGKDSGYKATDDNISCDRKTDRQINNSTSATKARVFRPRRQAAATGI